MVISQFKLTHNARSGPSNVVPNFMEIRSVVSKKKQEDGQELLSHYAFIYARCTKN